MLYQAILGYIMLYQTMLGYIRLDQAILGQLYQAILGYIRLYQAILDYIRLYQCTVPLEPSNSQFLKALRSHVKTLQKQLSRAILEHLSSRGSFPRFCCPRLPPLIGGRSRFKLKKPWRGRFKVVSLRENRLYWVKFYYIRLNQAILG